MRGCLFAFTLLNLTLVSPASAQAQLKIQTGQKVAFLGDSITAQGWDGHGGYIHLVVAGLAVEKVEITPIPAGRGGNTSQDMLARLDQEVLSKSPDWMTLSCGVNDVWHGAGGVDLDNYKKNITAIVDQAQAKGVKVMILTASCIGEDDNDYNRKLVVYNDFLRQLATEKKCPLVDLSATYAAALKADPPPPSTNLMTKDGVHPNPEGHMTIAKGILQGFGVPEADFPQIQTAWDSLETEITTGFGNHAVLIPLGDYRALQKEAAARHTNADGLINIRFMDASREVFTAHAQDAAPNFEQIRKEIQERFQNSLTKASTPPASSPPPK